MDLSDRYFCIELYTAGPDTVKNGRSRLFRQGLPFFVKAFQFGLDGIFFFGKFGDFRHIGEDFFFSKEFIDLFVAGLQLFDSVLHFFQIILTFAEQCLLFFLLFPVKLCLGLYWLFGSGNTGE